MKKIIALMMAVLTTFMIGSGIVLAADELTQSKPPIIPAGTYTTTKPGTSNISTIMLPGAGVDQGKTLQETVLPNITNIVISITGGLSLLFVIISGIQILTGFGNDEKIGEAKKTLLWALVGVVISLLSFAIVQIIVSVNIGVPDKTGKAKTSWIPVAYAAEAQVQQGSPDPNQLFHSFTGGDSKVAIVNNISNSTRGTWQQILANVIKFILAITGTLAFISFSAAGVILVTARGNEEQIKKGKDTLIWSIVALGIIAGSYALVLGVSELKF